MQNRWDDRLRGPAELRRRTPIALAGTVPTHLRNDETVLALRGPAGRAYARLRNLVSAAFEGRDRRVILVAGVRRGGGHVAANLAASLAQAGETVCLVGADPSVTTALSMPGQEHVAGRTDTVAHAATEWSTSLVPGVPNLRVMTLGRDPGDFGMPVQRRWLRELVDGLLNTASYVVVQVPPTTESPDAQSLAPVADLVVLVVEARRTRAREVSEAVAEFDSVRVPVLGAVLVRFRRELPFSRPSTRMEPPEVWSGAKEAASDAVAQSEGGHVADGRRSGQTLPAPRPLQPRTDLETTSTPRSRH